MIWTRLYVWTNVLHDYTAGMIVALAPGMDAALALARQADNPRVAEEMGAGTPEVTNVLVAADCKPQLWYVSGGG